MTAAADATTWELRAIPPSLGAGEVHVWFFPLQIPPGELEAWRAVLPPDESARAERFAFPHLRDRHVAAHAILRRLLGAYLNTDAAALRFEIAERGKPFLAGHPVHFNLSHTQDAALLAVTRRGQIGVDIERLDRKTDRRGIAERFFSPAEAVELGTLPLATQAEGFFNLWTRKEAWLKATGVGISEGLSKVEFNCPPGKPARLLRIDGDPKAAAEWWIRSLRPPGDHVGAVAMKVKTAKLRQLRYAANA